MPADGTQTEIRERLRELRRSDDQATRQAAEMVGSFLDIFDRLDTHALHEMVRDHSRIPLEKLQRQAQSMTLRHFNGPIEDDFRFALCLRVAAELADEMLRDAGLRSKAWGVCRMVLPEPVTRN